MIDQTQTLARRGASAILAAFAAYHGRFQDRTGRIQERFAARDWPGIQADAAARLDLYPASVNAIEAEIRALLGAALDAPELWAEMKSIYTELIAARPDCELAETFFNSLTRRIFRTVGVNSQREFVEPCVASPPLPTPLCRACAGPVSAALIEDLLAGYAFGAPFADMSGDAELVAAAIRDQLKGWPAEVRIEMIGAVLYRNKGAYLVGRISAGERWVPLVLAVLNPPGGLRVDAVLLDEREISILFSFAHSAFHVAAAQPAALVGFLAALLPRKPLAELYIAIGYNKHGKTLLYRDLLRHLAAATGTFEIARGERGMVMTVFTLASYNQVFKIIKDQFAPPKDTTRQQVKGKYQLVFRHDRAGRLIDAQEFEHLQLDRCRFSPALLDELLRVAGQTVQVEGEHVIIRHVYAQRRVTPLDVYLREADEEAARAATLEFGRAVKDLAVTNIFPGDMLLKNFGVTRHGRVVFYDYDEISLMTECNFKTMPAPSSYDEELAAEPWFAVGPNDVFPEEFGHFLGLRGPLRAVFMEAHAAILAAPFWQGIQARLRAGEILDIIPYSQRCRLRPSR